MNAGTRLAISRYPGYGLFKLWRDGRGLEVAIAVGLVQLALWLVGCDNVKVTPIKNAENKLQFLIVDERQ